MFSYSFTTQNANNHHLKSQHHGKAQQTGALALKEGPKFKTLPRMEQPEVGKS